jgi:hypothetical protein
MTAVLFLLILIGACSSGRVIWGNSFRATSHHLVRVRTRLVGLFRRGFLDSRATLIVTLLKSLWEIRPTALVPKHSGVSTRELTRAHKFEIRWHWWHLCKISFRYTGVLATVPSECNAARHLCISANRLRQVNQNNKQNVKWSVAHEARILHTCVHTILTYACVIHSVRLSASNYPTYSPHQSSTSKCAGHQLGMRSINTAHFIRLQMLSAV